MIWDHIGSCRRSPDITALILNSVLVLLLYFSNTNIPILSTVLSTIFLLFGAGYVTTSNIRLYGQQNRTGGGSKSESRFRVNQLVLSVCTSIIIAVLIGFVFSLTPLDIYGGTVVSLTIYTIVFGLLAIQRNDQTNYLYSLEWPKNPLDAGKLETCATVLLVLSVLLAVVSLIYLVGIAETGQSFTAFYILGTNGTGQPTATNYPSNITVGETEQVILSIKNRERKDMNYTLITKLQYSKSENESSKMAYVINSRGLIVSEQSTAETRVNITPTVAGENVRLSFFLFRGDVDSVKPTPKPYKKAHIWINITNNSRI